MLRKKHLVTMVTIAVMSFLVGTMFSTNLKALGSDESGIPFAKIWEAIFNLQARVTALEGSTDTKTWHYVTSFTLTSEEKVSPLFFVQGEKWRIKWELKWQPSGPYVFPIWDENGYLIDLIHVDWPLKFSNNPKGIHYVTHGKGSYYIELYSGPSVDFTIESYH